MKTLFLILVSLPIFLLAHGDNKHTKEKKIILEEEINTNQKTLVYKIINSEYIKNIKPIFEKKCFDCHSNTTNFSWYYKITGIKQLIDYDIKEAKKHMDMSKDFPFISHETPLKDLRSIQEVITLGYMPPFRHTLLHWDSILNKREKETIIRWSKEAILKLREDSYE